MPFQEIVRRARGAVEATGGDSDELGLARLAGGMSHDVFAPLDRPDLVVKVFQAAAQREANQEGEGLTLLATTGLAPAPVHRDLDGRPVVVMSRVAGTPLPAAALTEQHAAAIGAAHRRVHLATPPAPAPPEDSSAKALRAPLLAELPEETPDVVVQAWRAARSWAVAREDADAVTPPGEARFCRGDPNLGNYLWSGLDVVLVDWENSGCNNPVLELADLAEHASTGALGEPFWHDVAAATGLRDSERLRITEARRAMACFWLVLVESRQRQGLPTTITLEDQARKTLAALER